MKRQLTLVEVTTLGTALAHFRMQRGISQESLSFRSHVAQSSISRFENGADVRVSTVVRLCKAMGITLAELAAMASV